MISPIDSFKRMLTTPKGSRVMLPEFGSSLYKLVDRNFNDEWVLDFKRYSLECCFDESSKLWDDRVQIKSLNIKEINTNNGKFKVSFNLEFINGERFDVEI